MAKIERKLKEILNKERTVTSVADEFKVSRQTVYKWLDVYEKKGAKGFAYKKIKGGIFAAETLLKNNLDTKQKTEKSLDIPLTITEPLIDTRTPDELTPVSVVRDTSPVVAYTSPEALIVSPLVTTPELATPDKSEYALPSPASHYLRNQNTFFLVTQRLKTSAFMVLVAVIAIVSSFFIGAHDVAQFATLSVPASAESNISPTSLLSTISIKVYCGINYFMTSSETWKCKERAATPILLTKTESEANVQQVFVAPSVITKEVVKYIPSPVKIVKEKEVVPNIVNNYITKYVSVPGPKGDTGAPGAMGPSGSYSYVPVLTSMVSNSSPSNQNLTSPILTSAILNGISTFNGSLVAQDISANTLTVTGSTTLATTTVTALISSTLESVNASSTYATVEELFTTRAIITNSTTTSAYIVNLFGAGLSTCNSLGDKLIWNNGTFACGIDAGAGGGITNLNGSTATGQTFTSTSTGGLSLSISTATTTGVHTFAVNLASGYFIPQTASTTDWNNFFNTPTNYLTAGPNIIFSWSICTWNVWTR